MSTWLTVLPAVGGLAAMVLIFSAGGTSTQVAAGVLFGVSALAMAGGQLARTSGDRSRRIADDRRDYLRHLAKVRRAARSAATEQAEALFWLHPDPRGLLSLIRTSRLWERRPTDPDFASVRLGLGDQALALDLHLGEATTVDGADFVSATALRRLLRAHGTVRGLPVALDLRSFGVVRLEGNPVACREMAGAMVLQAITWHAPTEFRIALCADAPGMRAWDWLKWAPHLADPSVPPTDLPRFTVAPTLAGLEQLLSDELAGRHPASVTTDHLPDRSHIVVIVDGGVGTGGQLAQVPGPAGVTVIDLSGALAAPPGSRGLRLRVTEGDVVTVTVDRVGHEVLSHIGTPDRISKAEAAAVCRAVAAVRMPDDVDSDQPLTTSTGLPDLIGVANIRTLTPRSSWLPRPVRDRLRVAIGVGTNGQAVELDIKEAAQGGMGPHGLVVGATGSGKSELLRTLVLGLAITHPPDYLNFVLVDFKGGATFDKLEALPHISAVITNLADELGLVDRMNDAINGELNRRMELLRSAGSFASLRDYEQARAQGADLPAIPTLLIVVEEFSELLTAKPDFLDLFISIGRMGRSLGVHLLLASQRLEEGKLRGLDTYLSYRIGLKTFSAAESRIVLGSPDAFELPTAPGNGYLKFDTTGLVRFKAAFVSGPVRETRVGADHLGWVGPQAFRLTPPPATSPPTLGRAFTPEDQALAPGDGGPSAIVEARPAAPATPTAPARLEERGTAAPTLLEVAVSRLAGSGVPAHEVWLPPLTEPPSLDLLLPRGSVRASNSAPDSPAAPPAFLQVPLGWVDKPFEQTRGLLTVDLSGPAGNAAVVGAPQSGKSTALRSLICALALTHTPDEVQIYCLDFGGGSLSSLGGLPHVGVVAGRLQPELVLRTVGMVGRILTEREGRFAAEGINSLAHWREHVAAGSSGDGHGDVILVIDGWAAFREFFEPLEAAITSMAARGLNYGLHLVVAAGRWAEIRPALRDLIGTRIELRLGDPLDSEIDAKRAAGVPENRPGRGLSREGLHLLTAVPRIDGIGSTDGLAAATADLVQVVATRSAGTSAPPVRLLPTIVRPTDLRADLDPAVGYPLGLDEDLEPVFWNPDTDQHLLIFGAEQSGRTTVLRQLMRQIAARHGLDGARFIVFDAQRQLLDLPFRPGQLIASATTGRDAAGVVAANVEPLQSRLPTAAMTRQEIASRAWWGSPADIYLVVDNYERIAGNAPLAPLIPLIDHSADIALHLIIARQTRGASRAVFDGIYATLKDIGAPALVLSGPDAEGTIYGRTRVTDRPPGRGVWVPRRGAEVLMQATLDPQEW
jgi:S-DNA-T family DNA segregation ATPase FtsK/SpoIIIE